MFAMWATRLVIFRRPQSNITSTGEWVSKYICILYGTCTFVGGYNLCTLFIVTVFVHDRLFHICALLFHLLGCFLVVFWVFIFNSPLIEIYVQ